MTYWYSLCTLHAYVCVFNPAFELPKIDEYYVMLFLFTYLINCIRLHHQYGYHLDISYVGPVTSSTSLRHGRGWVIMHSRLLVHAPGMHFLLTFVVHPAWTLLRSVSKHICFLLLTSYNNLSLS